MSNPLWKILALAAAAGLLAAGCQTTAAPPPPRKSVAVAAPQEVMVSEAPPPTPFEVMTPAPGVGLQWIGGAYVWEDRWIWQPGHWELPPHPGAVWIPHHYEYRNGRHVFVRGGWR